MLALKLEICAFNLHSCIVAEKTGARRIELCADYAVGGTTPSFDLIKQVKDNLSIPVYPIIRPRGGGFLYKEEEFYQMLQAIQLCKTAGCEGIATGIHLHNGEIDTKRFSELVSAAYPMKVTCHRVFDRVPDPFKALEDIISIGCERILTSGLQNNAADAIPLLRQLVQIAGDRIIIMPGSGIRASNIQQIITGTDAKEFHTSARLPASEDIDVPELEQICNIIKLS